MSRRAHAVAVAAAITLVAPVVRAQAITTNHYAIDQNTGPVIGSARQIGLGGAFTALVDGLDGALWNPAAYAARPTNDAEYWHLDGTISASYITNDFDNSGNANAYYNYYVLGLAGAGFQYGSLGLGSMVEVHDYNIGTGSAALNATSVLAHVGIAYSFADGQLVLGIGGRYAVLSIWKNLGINTAVAQYQGWAGEVGAVFRPRNSHFRFGLAFHSEVDATTPSVPVSAAGTPSTTVVTGGGLILPEQVISPWQADIGVAYQFGARPWNARWENPSMDAHEMQLAHIADRRRRRATHETRLRTSTTRADRDAENAAYQANETAFAEADALALTAAQTPIRTARTARYAARPRRYVTAAVDLQVSGAISKSGATGTEQTTYGQGMDAFLTQTEHVSGRSTTVSPRLGIESEVWDNWLVLRLGSYYEPSRYAERSGRFHVTTGFDFHVLDTTFFGWFSTTGILINGVFDYASDYYNYGLGIGFWH